MQRIHLVLSYHRVIRFGKVKVLGVCQAIKSSCPMDRGGEVYAIGVHCRERGGQQHSHRDHRLNHLTDRRSREAFYVVYKAITKCLGPQILKDAVHLLSLRLVEIGAEHVQSYDTV